MRRLPRISVRITATGVGIALCVSVPVLAATGAFSGGTSHRTPRSAQLRTERAHILAQLASARAHLTAAERAHLRAEVRARERGASRAALRRLRAEQRSHLPRERHRRAARIAEKQLGVPYVWGGASPKVGFDTSGLVMYVYRQLGISLPHYTVSQWNDPHAVHIARSQLRPGDLVFFAGLSHVGIYIGGNTFVHAPNTGAVVRIDGITGPYLRDYDGAERIR